MQIKDKKRIILLTVFAVILIILIIWVAWGNKALELNIYTIENKKLPESFEGYRIAHISDLHNAEMGTDNKKLLSILQNSKPDIIAITGDMIDSRNTNIQIALHFAEQAVKIAPCYYVTGNHESRVSEYADLKKDLVDLGVTVLENENTIIECSGEYIMLIGINDPGFYTDYLLGDSETIVAAELKEIEKQEDIFTVLLSHRPELFDIYTQNNIDLALCGHAHGGQFRLPFIGGLVAPHQGLFPKYDAGLYTDESTSMIVSRGIGNSIIPFRFNNRPEVVLIELMH